jgi:hypothetical protein
MKKKPRKEALGTLAPIAIMIFLSLFIGFLLWGRFY